MSKVESQSMYNVLLEPAVSAQRNISNALMMMIGEDLHINEETYNGEMPRSPQEWISTAISDLKHLYLLCDN